MKKLVPIFILEKADLAANSSHIFLLKNKLHACIDDFVEGFNVWEKTKATIILTMAETLEKLQELGEYPDGVNTISTYIRHVLADRGVTDSQLDYVSLILPAKYKNDALARDQSARKIEPNSISTTTLQTNVNVYHLQKQLEGMSTTEFQDLCLESEQQAKHVRNNLKAIREAFEFVAIKKKIPMPRYAKTSSEVPPEELQGESALWHEVKALSQDFMEVHKYLEDISKSIFEFKPDNELASRLANQLLVFRKGYMRALKSLLIPYSDKKWSGDWIKWIDIHLTRLEQSKNYAGSKHKLETGEYAVKFKDGEEIIFALDRGITREQVGDKEPELFRMVQDMIIGIPMIQAFHQWSYDTDIEVDDTETTTQ